MAGPDLSQFGTPASPSSGASDLSQFGTPESRGGLPRRGDFSGISVPAAEPESGVSEQLGYLSTDLKISWNTLVKSYRGQRLAKFAEGIETGNRLRDKRSPDYDSETHQEYAQLYSDEQKKLREIDAESERLMREGGRPSYRKMQEINTGEWTLSNLANLGGHLLENPGAAVSIVVQSGPASAAMIAAAVLARFGGFSSAVAAGAGGAASGVVEFGNDYADLREKGTPHDEAYKQALVRSGVIGLLDAVSMKTAGSALDKVLERGGILGKAGIVTKELGRQAGLGMTGEAGGTLASGRTPDPLDVLAEGVGEVVFAPGEAMATFRGRRGPAPAGEPGGAIPATEALGEAEPRQQQPSLAPTRAPAAPTPLPPDRAAEAVTADTNTLPEGTPIRAVTGAPAPFSTESGVRLDAQYAVVESDQLTASHDTALKKNPSYPESLQPRDRSRAASEVQVARIAQTLIPERLGESADAATGAPIVGADGLVESGNARAIALRRLYLTQQGDRYKQWLAANAQRFGLTTDQVTGMRAPVLVRIRRTPVNRVEFARQANAPTTAQMAPSEQARADAARIGNLDDLIINESGDFAVGRNAGFIRRFVSSLPETERGALVTSAGALSQSGYIRLRNAILAKAYGDNPALLRLVESLDNNIRGATGALMRVAPLVARVRDAQRQGAIHDRDITDDVIRAMDELTRLRSEGKSVGEVLAQSNMFGELSQETVALIEFLDRNLKRPTAIAQFIERYLRLVESLGSPQQGAMFEQAIPGRGELISRVTKEVEGEGDRGDRGVVQKGAGKAGEAAGVAGAKAGAGRKEPVPGAAQPGKKGGERPGGAADRGAGATGVKEGPTTPPAGPEAAAKKGVAEEIKQAVAAKEPAKPQSDLFAPVQEAAAQAATSPENQLPLPTEAQKEAGNYQKGHVTIAGLDISIENPRGSVRSGVDRGGKPWQVRMTDHYGYVKGSEARDGDQVDVYLRSGSDPTRTTVYVIDQRDIGTDRFDEHKAVLGSRSPAEAAAIYDRHFSDAKGPQRRAAIIEMSLDEFKGWLRKGKTTAPIAGQGVGRDVTARLAGARATSPITAEVQRMVRKPAPELSEDVRQTVAAMRSEIGHEERGGRMIKDETNTGPDTGERSRTAWLGQRWWFDRPDKLDAAGARRAVDKALAGESLGVREQRFVDYVMEIARQRNAEMAEAQQDAAARTTHVGPEWATLTEDQKDEELDRIFGADTRPVPQEAAIRPAEGAATRAREAGQEVPAQATSEVALTGQRPADLTPAAEQARTREATQREERAIADRERGALTLTPPAGTTTAQPLTEPRNQQSLLTVETPNRSGTTVSTVESKQSSDTTAQNLGTSEQEPTKEPWQMTQTEYARQREGVYIQKRGGSVPAQAANSVGIAAAKQHDRLVREAIAAGRPVPAEVLADYPDLVQKPAPFTERERTTEREQPQQGKQSRTRDQVVADIEALIVVAEGRQQAAKDESIRALRPTASDWMSPEEFERYQDLQAELAPLNKQERRNAAERVEQKRASRLAQRAKDEQEIPKASRSTDFSRFALQRRISKNGLPIFGSREIALLDPVSALLGKEMLVDYQIYDTQEALRLKAAGENRAGAQVGIINLSLDPATSRILALNIILIDPEKQAVARRKAGAEPMRYGERAVRAIVASLPEGAGLKINQILPSAVEFWRKLGVVPERGAILYNGILTRQAYEQARGQDFGQSARPDRMAGVGAQAPEGTADSGEVRGDRQRPGGARLSRAIGGDLSDFADFLESPVATGLSASEAQKFIDRVAKRIAVPITLHDNPEAMDRAAGAVGLPPDSRGAYHKGRIYLALSNIRDIADLQTVLWHEIFHAGFNHLVAEWSRPYQQALDDIAARNKNVRTRAAAWRVSFGKDFAERLRDRGIRGPKSIERLTQLRSYEEALANLSGENVEIAGIKDFLAALQKLLRKLGLDSVSDWMEGKSDAEALSLIRRARDAVTRPTESSVLTAENAPAYTAKLSRQATPAPTPEQRADTMLAQPRGTAPLDAIFSGVSTITGLTRVTKAVGRKVGEWADRYVPEPVKSGIVSDYGLPEVVVDHRDAMFAHIRQQIRKTGTILDKLATLTREESRIAYEWMNDRNADALLARLPEASRETLTGMKQWIEDLSKEAVRRGQLSDDAYKRHSMAYVHRSYRKYEMDQTPGEKASRARVMRVLGDQYKGRGMFDPVDMNKVRAPNPEWWERKLKAGKADQALKGEKFIRLEKRANRGEGVAVLPGILDTGQKGKLLTVTYWPADVAVPSTLADHEQAGIWEVRGVKQGRVIMWRDFTKEERTRMGELDEVRFAFGKTMQQMVHDIEVGRHLEWLANTQSRPEPPQDAKTAEASELLRRVYAPDTWVKVPDAEIPRSGGVKKYGKLAGLWVTGPIWNDIRQVVNYRYQPLGETYAKILRAWKISKTALSPTVHTNNVMANVIMADWHDVTGSHIFAALRVLLNQQDPAHKRIVERFEDAGGLQGMYVLSELQREQLRPLLAQLEREVNRADGMTGVVNAANFVQLLLSARVREAWASIEQSRPAGLVKTGAGALMDLYQFEDTLFRMAAFIKAKSEGFSDVAAGKVARRSFMDYQINAPWINVMRNSVFPFIAFTYRALPMLWDTAVNKPWKLMKLAVILGTLNALGYALSGGDEDEERRLMPEEKAGRVLGFLTPKLVRMPWNDPHGSPVFLDIRRYIPLGDIVDFGSGHAAVPMLPATMPSGPLMALAEILLNKKGFTGTPITKETDSPGEVALKLADYAYKTFAPNLPILPGTYSFGGILRAGTGQTDAFGRERSVSQAVASSVGIKLESYPRDVMLQRAQRELQAKEREIGENIWGLRRQHQRGALSRDELIEQTRRQEQKREGLRRLHRDKVTGR